MKKPAFSFRIENDILSKIDKLAAAEDRTRGAVIRKILKEFFLVSANSESEKEKKA